MGTFSDNYDNQHHHYCKVHKYVYNALPKSYGLPQTLIWNPQYLNLVTYSIKKTQQHSTARSKNMFATLYHQFEQHDDIKLFHNNHFGSNGKEYNLAYKVKKIMRLNTV